MTSGPRPSHEIKEEVAKRLGCARKTVERHAVRMAERDELNIESGGFPRTTTWALPSTDSAVGTSLDARGVPTEEIVTPEGFSVPTEGSRDTGASPTGDVSTGGGGYRPVCRCTVVERSADGRCERCHGWPEEPS